MCAVFLHTDRDHDGEDQPPEVDDDPAEHHDPEEPDDQTASGAAPCHTPKYTKPELERKDLT